MDHKEKYKLEYELLVNLGWKKFQYCGEFYRFEKKNKAISPVIICQEEDKWCISDGNIYNHSPDLYNMVLMESY